MAHYRITPLEKKSIIARFERYRENEDGTISWFNIEDHYRWGVGFIAEDDEINLSESGSLSELCRMDAGEYEGCEFDDSIACYFEFSDDITEEEKEEIQNCYLRGDENGLGGHGWLEDGEHDWHEEDTYVQISAPYRVEFCDEDGAVIREVKLRTWEEITELRESLGDGWYVPKDSALEPHKWND